MKDAKKLFVSSKIAKLVKGIGFDEDCFAFYGWNFGIPKKQKPKLINVGGTMKISGTSAEPEYADFNLFADSYYFKGIICAKNSYLRQFTLKDGRKPQYISCPLRQQVTDWLREKNGIAVEASAFSVYNGKFGYRMYYVGDTTGGYNVCDHAKNYYEALEEAFESAIELINKIKHRP